MRKHDQGSAATERDRKGRFSARRKRETVLRLLRGEDLESVSRELMITAARRRSDGISFWSLARRDSRVARRRLGTDDNRRLQAKIGKLLMENELLYAKVDHLEAGVPLARLRSTR